MNRLVLVMGKDGFTIGGTAYVFLPYMYIGAVELGFTAEGQVFRFIVTEAQSRLVTVSGHNLTHVCDHIAQRRMQWIRESDQDFRVPASGDDPIITRIDIREWRPEDCQPDNLMPFAA